MVKKKGKKKSFFDVVGRKGLWGKKADNDEEEEEKNGRAEKIVLEPKITLSPNITVNNKKEESTFWNIIKLVFLIALIGGIVFYFFVSPAGQVMWSKFSAGSGFFSSLSSLFNPQETFGDWRNPMPVRIDEKEDTGIIIRNFADTRAVHPLDGKESDYVNAVAEGEVVNLKEDLDVEFSCSMDISLVTNALVSIPGTVVISPGKEYGESAKKTFYSEKGDQDFIINCRINNVDVKKEIENGKIGDRTAFAGIIALKAVSDAQTRSSIRVYTSAKELSAKEKSNFEASLRADNLWHSSKRVISLTRGGTMDAFIDIKKIQPITELGSYFFTTGLMNTKGWKGKLEKLNDVELIPSEGMSIDPEQCQDFENTKLKSELIDAINNKKCRVESKGSYGAECILVGINVDNLPFSCKADIEELNPDLGYSLLMADFDYSYAVTSTTTASFQTNKPTAK